MTGYNGSFEFEEPGQLYNDTPYVGMRVVGPCCVLVIIIIVCTGLAIRHSNGSVCVVEWHPFIHVSVYIFNSIPMCVGLCSDGPPGSAIGVPDCLGAGQIYDGCVSRWCVVAL